MKYLVRPGFYVHLGEGNIALPGTVLDLTPELFQLYAHQLEVFEKQESKRAKVQS